MAAVDCKRCGGVLDIIGKGSTAKCKYCGTEQTIPRLFDDKILALYERAGHLRRNSEYDRALEIYENILNETPNDAEAYWSIILCRYGLVYVEDAKTKKRLPTITRIQNTSLLADEDYKAALKYADAEQKVIYEAEANEIERIRQQFVTISREEEPYDVFICYKDKDEKGKPTEDRYIALEIYNRLHRDGFKVFFAHITLDDKLGHEYEPYIFAALNSAKVMIVLGTRPEYFTAPWLRNEWSRYISLIKAGKKKTLISAFKNMDAGDLPDELKLQAQDMSKMGFMENLVYVTTREIERNGGGQKKPEPQTSAPARDSVTPPPRPTTKKHPLIKSVSSIGSCDFTNAWPEGMYSPTINRDHFKVIYFHIVTERIPNIDKIKTMIFIRDEAGNLVFENNASYDWKENYDRIALSWIINGNMGTLANTGKYYADIYLQDKEKFTYEFEVTSDELERRKLQASRPVKPVKPQPAPTPAAPRKKGKGKKVAIGIVAALVLIVGALAGLTAFFEGLDKGVISIPSFNGNNNNNNNNNNEDLGGGDNVGNIITYDGIAYEILNDSEVAVSYYRGDAETIEIPSDMDGYTVSGIFSGAFSDNPSIRKIVVPFSVKEIGEGAFAYCPNITEIVLPFVGGSASEEDQRTAVLGHIFTDTSSVHTGEANKTSGATGLTTQGINNEAYDYIIPEALRKVTITGQTAVPAHAFQNCDRIEEIYFESPLTSIGEYAFAGCTELLELGFGAAEFAAIEQCAFMDCSGFKSFTIPEGVEKIKNAIFSGCSALEEIYIPESLKLIGERAFANCLSLKEIYIPATVKTIEKSIFSGSTRLTRITVPFIGKTINEPNVLGYLFSDPQTVSSNARTSKGGYTTQSEATESRDSMGYYNYSYDAYEISAALREVVVTEQTFVPEYAFANCDLLTSVVYEQPVTEVAAHAFKNCESITELIGNIAPESTIGESAFSNCLSLTEVVIPEGVVKIGRDAFSGCAGLTTVVIPNTVRNMGLPIFQNCNKLSAIKLPFIGTTPNTTTTFGKLFSTSSTESDPARTSDNAGYTSQSNNNGVSVDRAHYTAYKIPQSVREVTVTLQTSVTDFTFMNCDLLTHVTFEKELSYIGNYAFADCRNVESFTGTLAADSFIGDYAFKGCESITECSIPEGVTRIGKGAFLGCTSIGRVEIPSTVKTIDTSAFGGCSALEELIIKEGVTTINSSAFSGCSALNEVFVPSSVKSMSYGIFSGCNNLRALVVPYIGTSISDTTSTLGFFFGNPATYTSTQDKTSGSTAYTTQAPYNGSTYYYCYYSIPKSLRNVLVTEQTVISDYAFANCDLLTEIGYVKITEVGDYAFKNCAELSTIYYGGSLDDYNSVTFGAGWKSGAAEFTVEADYDFGNSHLPG